jgi:beta-glucuronidase
MFGGITRSVVVHEQPAAVYLQHIETYTTDWKACGVDVRVVVGGSFSTHTAVSLTLQWDGGVADGPFSGTPDASGGVWVRGAVVPKCSPWNPALHTVLVTLLAPGDDAEDGGAAAADAILVRFGVRQVGASGGRFTVNGEVVKLRGYNRHTMYPDTGSALTLAQVQEDAQLLASLHANWLRGAHYPQDQRLLDITDEMGIMVWEETLGPSVSVSDIEDPYFMQYHVQALNEMVSASFNHPSVVMHGFFNEGRS